MNRYNLQLVLFFAALFIIAIPFGSIWSLNTLFGLNIDYNLETWLASLFLTSIVTGQRNTKQ